MKPNVAASVRDRLLSQAKEKGEEFERRWDPIGPWRSPDSKAEGTP